MAIGSVNPSFIRLYSRRGGVLEILVDKKSQSANIELSGDGQRIGFTQTMLQSDCRNIIKDFYARVENADDPIYKVVANNGFDRFEVKTSKIDPNAHRVTVQNRFTDEVSVQRVNTAQAECVAKSAIESVLNYMA